MIPVASVLMLLWSFASGDGGFVPSAGGVQWRWGVPTSGPGGADAMWATNLGGNYLNDARDTLLVPIPDLSGTTHPVLRIDHWYEIQPGDAGWIEVNDGGGWVKVDPVYGYPAGTSFTSSSGGWLSSTVDLRGYGANPQVRLVFDADAALTAAGWYVAKMELHDGDITAPLVTPVSVPQDTEVFGSGYPVQVQVVDDVGVSAVDLEVSVNASPLAPIAMTDLGGGLYEGLIPAQAHRSVVSWSAVADDGSQLGRWPQTGTSSFVVALRPPTGFAAVEADGRVVGNEATFRWTAPDTLHTVDGYWLSAVDVAGTGRTVLDTVWVDAGKAEGMVVLDPDGPRTFDLVAEYAGFGPSEPTPPVTVSLEAAALLSVVPEVAYQGDRVRVRIRGENLYLDAGDYVEFDSRIVAEPLVVETVNDATSVLEIPENAPTGPVGITVTTQWGSYRFEDAFTVRSGDEAPRIVRVDPATIRQGEAATVEIQASSAFAGPVSVDAGEDLLVVEDPMVEGGLVTVELVVGGGASPGAHTLILDDGSRLWEADLVVQERVFNGKTGCGGCNGAPDAPPFAPWLLFLLLARRRC